MPETAGTPLAATPFDATALPARIATA
jgi:hypothetical protein